MPPCLTENTVVDALEGVLSARDRAEVDAHVDTCVGCRRLLEMMTTTATGSVGDVAAAPPEVPGALPGPGTSVGRYVIDRLLGSGGMGLVYAAHDPELDRAVAIKLIRPELGAGSDTMAQRLVRESRAMAQLAHPNVLAVHDVGRVEGQVFIAMELAAGGTLGQWLAAERRPWREIVARFCLAGRGLQAAHETGLVHRDFKPDNVLLTGDGGVRVADFGLVGSGGDPAAGPSAGQPAELPPARIALTRTGARLGTPLYMAPEQHDGDRVGPAADQFAFAVALLEAIHGEHPFGASSYPELVAAVRSARIRPAPPAPDGDGPPPALREALTRALRTAPDERWPSMRALLDALERVLNASGRATEPSDPRERAEASALRRRLEHIAAMAAAGLYGEALPLAHALRDEAAALGHAPLVAEVLYALGSLEVSVGDWRAAERTLSDAAVAAARARDDGLAARIWSDLLVLVGHREGRSTEAQLLRPAAEAALARCGEDPEVQGRFLVNVGVVLSDRAEYAEARASLERAAALYREAFGPDDVEVGRVENNLGYLSTRLGAYREARAHLDRARVIWGRGGPDHPHVAICLNNLGELACEEGRLDEAASHHVAAIAIRERVLRPDHPFLALSLHNLGTVRRRQGRAEEARALLERALAIRSAALGEHHVDVAESTAGLGAALARLGRADEALPLLERALRSAERALGPDHARTAELARMHGVVLDAAGEPEAAEAALVGALAASERGLGGAHAQVVRALASLARARLRRGRMAEAVEDARRAVEIATALGMSDEARAELGDLLAQTAAAGDLVDRG